MPNEKGVLARVVAPAGVSRSAVGQVFTPGASASEKTVERVRAATEDLGHRPDALACGLITGRTRLIGQVVAYLDNQFYPVALKRALQVPCRLQRWPPAPF